MWSTAVQEAVTSIRNAGANNQTILLSGTLYTSLGAFDSDGSAAALDAVTNPDGSKNGLVFDVHQYLDSDSSGTHAECTTSGVDNLNSFASSLRDIGRQAYADIQNLFHHGEFSC